MSYRCGLSPEVARMMGTDAGPPRITCDDCGIRKVIGADRPPPSWFLNGNPPPGWRTVRQGDIRRDYCGKCKDKEPTL